MKLKCKINGKDYDIVQGCTFTDNFNETLDSAVICIDQIPEIIDLKPYTDVYIWNADEEFDGYYCIGDYLFIDCTIDTEILSTGTNWNTWYPYNFQTPYTNKPLFQYSVDSETGIGTMSGLFWDIWFERFLCANQEEADNLRYRNGRGIGNGLNFDMRLTIRNEAGNTRNDHILYFEVDKPFYDGTNIIRLVQETGVQGNIPLVKPIICSYDIQNKTISFDSVQNANLFLYETFTIIGITTWYDNYVSYRKDYQKQFDLVFNTDTFDELDTFDIEVKYLNNWIKAIPSVDVIDDDNVNLILSVYPLNNAQHYDITVALEKHVNENGKPFFSGSYINDIDTLVDQNPTFWGLVDDIRVLSLSIIAQDYSPLPTFFKHMLVDDFNKTRLQLKDSYTNKEALFKYEINLFSETKKLEKIPLPNISVTQSIVEEEKRSCWFYLERFVDLYSPKYKKSTNVGRKTWKYISKYYVSRTDNNYLKQLNPHIVTNLKEIFENVICPEFSLTNPSLKDVISQILITKDLIPIVFNDVIYGLDIGATEYEDFNRNGTNFDVSNMTSDNYATDARREYGNALSQENSAHLVEYMGFRNPNSAFLTLEDMVLETRFPIYKINSIKMCFYKRFSLTNHTTGERIVGKSFLCKYDITPFVLQNVVRNTLSTNWQTYNNWHEGLSGTIEEKIKTISQYKLCTVGYDIGSNKITGWGTTYEYLSFLWFKKGYSYIQNLINVLNEVSFVGTEIYDSYLQTLDGDNDNPGTYEVDIIQSATDEDLTYIVPFSGDNNLPNRLKSIVFEIDYDAMYNGAVKHSKDYIDEDDIETVDNCSAALTVLETDGLLEKEKLNRMSNPIFKIPARYDNENGGATIDKVQKLATYDEITDSIVYNREYQIYDNVIFANYESTKEYVLKNYFTSVWAKYRTYSYMSFGESIKRAENFREFLILGKNSLYFENEQLINSDSSFNNTYLSFLLPTEVNSIGVLKNDYRINCGYFDINDKKYLSDVNSFASGTSICYNILMMDNVSGGTYIDSMSANPNLADMSLEQKLNYKATQLWYQMPESKSDAFIENIGIYFCNLNNSTFWKDGIVDNNDFLTNVDRFLHLPAISEDLTEYQNVVCGNNFVLNKDNKEVIDATFQFDYITSFLEKDNLLFSPWVAKLNDTVGIYRKYEQNKNIATKVNSGDPIDCYIYQTSNNTKEIVVKISDYELDRIIDTLANNNPYIFLDAEFLNKFSYASGLLKYPSGSLSTHIEFRNGANTLQLDRIVGTSIEGGVRTFSLLLNFIGKQTTITHWYPFIDIGIYWDWHTETSYKNVERASTSTLTFVKSETIDNVTYHYFKGSISSNVFSVAEYYLDGTYYGSFNTGYRGTSDVLDLNSNNSIYQSINGSATSPSYDTVDETNMILIVSTNKLKNNLVYNSYKVNENNHVDLPEGMYIDTNGINGVVNGHLVPEIFSVIENVITVNAQEYNNYEKNIQSIQYYYKDDNGWLHFVFGVNVERNFDYQYENFNVYLSNVYKRDIRVFDDKHKLIGYSKNYQKIVVNQEKYGENQYYVLGKLKAPIIGSITWEYSRRNITNFIAEVNNSNNHIVNIMFSPKAINSHITAPIGDYRLIAFPNRSLEENEIDITDELGDVIKQYVENYLNFDLNILYTDLNGDYESSDEAILLERRIGQLYPPQLRLVHDEDGQDNFYIEMYNPNQIACDLVFSYPSYDYEISHGSSIFIVHNVQPGVFRLYANPEEELQDNEFDITDDLENGFWDYQDGNLLFDVLAYLAKPNDESKRSTNMVVIKQNHMNAPILIDIENASTPISDLRFILKNYNSTSVANNLVIKHIYGQDQEEILGTISNVLGTSNIGSSREFALVVIPATSLKENEFNATNILLPKVQAWLNGQLTDTVYVEFVDGNGEAISSSANEIMEVNVPIITGIEITNPASRISFYTDFDTFTSSGLVVTATYNDGHTAIVTPVVTAPSLDTIGQKNVVVSYTENHITKTTSYRIFVLRTIPTSIVDQSGQEEFTVGDAFVGKSIIATYNSGITRNVTNDCTYTGYDMTAAGEQTVTVSYSFNGVTVSVDYDILVNPSSVASPTVSSISYSTPQISSWYFTVRNPNNFPCTLVIEYSSSTPIELVIGANQTLTVDNSNAAYLTASVTEMNNYNLDDDVYCYLKWDENIRSNNVMIMEANYFIYAPSVFDVTYGRDMFDPNEIQYQFSILNNNPYPVIVHFATGFYHDTELLVSVEIQPGEMKMFGRPYGEEFYELTNIFRQVINGLSEHLVCWFTLESGSVVVKTSDDATILAG